MACTSKTIRVTTITFNGINHTPLNNSAEITMGGEVADGTVVNNAGKAFSGSKMEPGMVAFEMPATAGFNVDNYRGQCGDVQVLTSDGASYLCTNAQYKENTKLKDGDPKVKLEFVGDAIVLY